MLKTKGANFNVDDNYMVDVRLISILFLEKMTHDYVIMQVDCQIWLMQRLAPPVIIDENSLGRDRC